MSNSGGVLGGVAGPRVTKTVTATAAGNTVVWTPAAGKRFRLISYSIEVTANASLAAGAVDELTLNDAGAAIGQGCSVFIPTAAGATITGNYDTGWRDLGNGYLSAAINQSLQLNIATALTAGEVRVNVIGTEE